MNHVNTFTGGMNTDVSPEYIQSNKYIYGENFKLTVDEQNHTLNIDTGYGPKLLAYKNGFSLVGLHKVNDLVILFFKNNTPGGANYIYKISTSTLSSKSNANIDSDSAFIQIIRGTNLIFGNSLSIVHSIENDTTWNVYFSSNDIFAPIMRINVLQTYGDIGSNISSISLFNNTVVYNAKVDSLSIVAGALKCGTYRYVYQIFDKGGSETVYSSPTPPIPLTSSEYTSSSNSFLGSLSPDENSGKGIKLKLLNLNNKYCRVVRMYYADSINLPVCSIIYEGKIISDTFYITDSSSENVIGTTSIEDIAISYTPVQAKHIESKNGYLFLANIKEGEFDVDIDTRAYRRNSMGRIPLYNPSTGDVVILDNIPNQNDYKNYLDYCNPYNLLDKNYSGNDIGIYRSDGNAFGGSGPHIHFSFVYKTIKFTDVNVAESADAGTKIFWKLNSMNFINSPVIRSDESFYNILSMWGGDITIVGFQRDEIYRFGIVFYNAQGQRTPVKWIEDIRFPTIANNNGAWNLYHSDTEARVLGIQFLVSNLPSEIVAYQIVRAVRTRENSTVLDAGILSSLFHKDGILYVGNIHPKNVPLHQTSDGYNNAYPRALNTYAACQGSLYYDFISPEAAYYKEWRVSARKIVAFNTISYLHNAAVKTGSSIDFSFWGSPACANVRPTSTQQTHEANITDSYFYEYRKTQDNAIEIPMDGKKMFNLTARVVESDHARRGNRYSSFILKLSSNISCSINTHPLYAYRKQIIYPYGGYTQTAKENTKYIPCSEIINKSVTDIHLYTGDTYVGIFEYMLSILNEDVPRKYKQPIAVQALVESRINLWYAGTAGVPKLSDGEVWRANKDDYACFDSDPDKWGYWALHEAAGIHNITADKTKTYVQAQDLYTYNSAYSQNDPKIYYYPELSLQSDVDEFTTRIVKTPKKLNNALSDTWSRININDYMDLDSKAGNLIKFMEISQGLVAFQQMGIAIIPVEERALINDASGSQLVAGKSGVLERYDYITNLYGITSGKHVTKSANGIYFLDANKKVIGRISDKLEIISTSLGVQKFLNTQQFSPNQAIVVDLVSKEVLFPVSNGSLLLFEDMGVFVSKLDSIYSLGINAEPHCFGAYNDSGQTRLYELNKGTASVYKTGSNPKPSKFVLKFVVNPNVGTIIRLDELSLNAVNTMDLQDNAGLLTAVNVANNYQEATSLNRLPVKRFRNWRTNYLRTNSGERLMDYYHIVTFEHGSNDEYNLILKSVVSEITPIFNR